MILPVVRMTERIAIERSDSDLALFNVLMYTGEMVLKLVVAGMVASIGDDAERNRDRLVRRLLRADGLGDWAAVLDEVLQGPSTRFLDSGAREAQRQLTQNCDHGSWQYLAVSKMRACISRIKPDGEILGAKVQARNWFRDFVQ